MSDTACDTAAPIRDTRVAANTKDRGDVSEAFVQAHLLSLGACVLKPFGDNQRFDLAVYLHARFHRIQVKTARLVSGTLLINLYSQSRAARRSYSTDVDFICAWSPELQRAYLFRLDTLLDTRGGRATDAPLQHRVALRVAPARNRQRAGTRWAQDYELRDLTPFEGGSTRATPRT